MKESIYNIQHLENNVNRGFTIHNRGFYPNLIPLSLYPLGTKSSHPWIAINQRDRLLLYEPIHVALRNEVIRDEPETQARPGFALE